MVDWPSTLPQRPLADDWSEELPDLLLRSPMDIGPAKTRRRTTAGVTPVQASFRMTPTELAAFRTFYQTTVVSGSVPFDWVHPITGETLSWQIVPKPRITPYRSNSPNYRVSLQLEALP